MSLLPSLQLTLAADTLRLSGIAGSGGASDHSDSQLRLQLRWWR
jgi:hypothetical protein